MCVSMCPLCSPGGVAVGEYRYCATGGGITQPADATCDGEGLYDTAATTRMLGMALRL